MTQDVEMKELPAPSNSASSPPHSTLYRKIILCIQMRVDICTAWFLFCVNFGQRCKFLKLFIGVSVEYPVYWELRVKVWILWWIMCHRCVMSCFRFEGDCVSHWDRCVCPGGSTYSACGQAHDGSEAEAQCAGTLCLPQLRSPPGIWVAQSIVLVSSEGNVWGLVSLGPLNFMFLCKLYGSSWNVVCFLEGWKLSMEVLGQWCT